MHDDSSALTCDPRALPGLCHLLQLRPVLSAPAASSARQGRMTRPAHLDLARPEVRELRLGNGRGVQLRAAAVLRRELPVIEAVLQHDVRPVPAAKRGEVPQTLRLAILGGRAVLALRPCVLYARPLATRRQTHLSVSDWLRLKYTTSGAPATGFSGTVTSIHVSRPGGE